MDPMVTGWKRYVLVQPPMMILFFAYGMSGTILTDLIEYHTCRVTLGINETECSMLHKNSSSSEALKIDALVQPHTSLILMMRTFIDTFLPSFLSLFLGAWSDKYGRKPILMSGYIGTFLTYTSLTIMCNWDIEPSFLLLCSVPTAFFGGICVIALASACYISDVTDDHNRAWHLAWLEALYALGLFLGILVGPIIFKEYGYVWVFGIAAGCCIFATLYVLIFVPETVQRGYSGTWSSLFDFALVKDLVGACIKKRAGFNRRIVWSCIACMALTTVIVDGNITVGYMFASARLGWDVKTFSFYSGTNMVLGIIGTLFGVKVIGMCTGLSEVMIAMISITSSFAASIVRAFTWHPWHMYLATVVGMLSGVSSPIMRSVLSKAVPFEDVGKVFSLTTCLETLTPTGAASLYGLIYSHFMPPLYPSPVWLISAGICVGIILLLMYVQVQIWKSHRIQYIPVPQDDCE